jgi:hypothetical protein
MSTEAALLLIEKIRIADAKNPVPGFFMPTTLAARVQVVKPSRRRAA